MCIPIHQRDPRTRFLMVFGNVSLCAALILWVFFRPALAASHAWLDGLYGLLFGISIGANLIAVYRARHCRSADAN